MNNIYKKVQASSETVMQQSVKRWVHDKVERQ